MDTETEKGNLILAPIYGMMVLGKKTHVAEQVFHMKKMEQLQKENGKIMI